MKGKAFAFILLAVLLALFVTPVYAQSIPSLPHAFYGAVKVNGSLALVGTTVEARGEGVQTGVQNNPVVTTVEGQYGSSNPLEPKLIVQGNVAEGTILTFYVNGVRADQTAEWHSGEVTQLDVTATVEGPPPETTQAPLPKPAAFSLSSLTISPNEVAIGESVTTSVNVANTGEQAGNYSLTLKVDGAVEATKDITVAAAASQEVTFTTAKDLPGSHSVDINGLTGTFVVKEAPSAPPAPPTPSTPPAPSETPSPPTPPTPPAPPSAAESINWPVLLAVLGGMVVVGLIILVVSTRRSY
jgi:hypothetical protein